MHKRLATYHFRRIEIIASWWWLQSPLLLQVYLYLTSIPSISSIQSYWHCVQDLTVVFIEREMQGRMQRNELERRGYIEWKRNRNGMNEDEQPRSQFMLIILLSQRSFVLFDVVSHLSYTLSFEHFLSPTHLLFALANYSLGTPLKTKCNLYPNESFGLPPERHWLCIWLYDTHSVQ